MRNQHYRLVMGMKFRLVSPIGKRWRPSCGSFSTHEAKHPRSPYRCRDCRKYFSVKTASVMANSKIPLQNRAFAIYLETTSLKGVSSCKLVRDMDISRPTAWLLRSILPVR